MPCRVLTYEEACAIAGVPLNRGFVTYAEVVNGLRKAIPHMFDDIEITPSNEIGWMSDAEKRRIKV